MRRTNSARVSRAYIRIRHSSEEGAATQEIVRNVQQAARGIKDVAAEALSEQSQVLRARVDEFLGDVRAA